MARFLRHALSRARRLLKRLMPVLLMRTGSSCSTASRSPDSCFCTQEGASGMPDDCQFQPTPRKLQKTSATQSRRSIRGPAG